MPMFHMAGHSVQRMWTGFGVRSPYNLRMVMVMVIWNRNHAKWETVGSSRMPPVTVKAAAAAAISLGHATCCHRGWADPKILCPHQSADSDHRFATASAGRCCLGSAVCPRICNSLSGPSLLVWAWLGHWSTINSCSCTAWSWGWLG